MRFSVFLSLDGTDDNQKQFFHSEEPFIWFGLEHKYYNVQVDYWGWRNLFDFTLDLSLKGRDHAGIEFSMTVLGFGFVLQIYDTRHWDDETNQWV